MAYNTTEKEKHRAAAKDTAKKLKRETILKAALLAGYFLPIAKSFQRFYSTNGSIPSLTEHNRNLKDILNKSYRLTAKQFDNQVRKALGKPNNSDEIDDQIQIANETQQLLDINESHKSIAKTTHDKLHKTVRDVIIGTAVIGIPLNNRQIAKQARDSFLQDSKNRLDTIGVTEVQGAAEGSKYNELGTLVRNDAFFPKVGVPLSKTVVKKTWVAILDRKTRPAHRKADGQTVELHEPYIVMGEKLKYPRDTSLGATEKNIINCRCASVQSIKVR